MAANNRIYWAVQAVGIAPEGSLSFTEIHGLQSVGITTTFNLEQVFEIGQLAIYENIENIPDVEVTLEKVIDGYPLIYHLSTQGAGAAGLAGRSNQKCNIALSIFNDEQESASGDAIAEVDMSGMFVSTLTYTMPVEGNCTEAVTLVGNNKVWIADGSENFEGAPLAAAFGNVDEPLALTSGDGGVQRREDVIFDVGSIPAHPSIPDGTILPGGTNGVEGITSSGVNTKTNDVYGAHIQNITISTDLGREALNELGRRGPYFRFVNFPVEVTTEIETISIQGDQVGATEEGVISAGVNLNDQRINVVLRDSTTLYMGEKNKLASVTYGGGDAGGGNATSTYTFTTFNDLTVTHDQDPSPP
jgi:hypothetical protein